MSSLDEIRARLVTRLRTRRMEMSDIIWTHVTATGTGSFDGTNSGVAALRDSIAAVD
jgi:hypothetical protein